MQYKQWLWKGSLTAFLGVAFTNPVAAQQPLNHDSGGGIPTTHSITIGSGGDSANSLSRIRRRAFNPSTGEINFVFQGFNGGFSIDPGITIDGRLGGNGASLEGDGSSTTAPSDSAQCTGDLCQESVAGESQEITLNEIAELLEIDLNRSLEQLAMAEDAVQKASLEPRRIVRRSSQNECVNPYIKAREEVESKLEQSKKFIEQVDPIEPQNELW